jgi:hypothetical protein
MNTTRGIQTAGARGPLSLCSWLAPDCTRVHQEFHGEVKPQPRSRSRKETPSTENPRTRRERLWAHPNRPVRPTTGLARGRRKRIEPLTSSVSRKCDTQGSDQHFRSSERFAMSQEYRRAPAGSVGS